MKRVKRRIFAGAVCEQIVYNVADRTVDIKHSEPRVRFRTEEERANHRTEKSRRHHAQLVNANFGPGDLYATLTMDDDHEVHDFASAKHVRDLYIRRLRRSYPEAVIFAYLGRGKSTHRIHMHMLVHGIPAEVLTAKWGQGSACRISQLRSSCSYAGVDHGQDYTGIANYLFAHWTPEQGGHRWYMTKNAKQPEREDAKEIRRTYTTEKPPIAPKGYRFVEAEQTEYGLLRFLYVIDHPRKRKR